MSRSSLSDRRALIKEADKWFSKLVRLRGVCERCGQGHDLQCAHIFSRRYQGVRFNPANALCLCKGCHHWTHQHPLEGEDFFRQKIGQEAYEKLRIKALAGGKGMDLEALIIWLKQEVQHG